MKRYDYTSKYTGRNYSITRREDGMWILENWSHGGLMVAATKRECREYMETVDHYSMDDDGKILDDGGITPLPVVS